MKPKEDEDFDEDLENMVEKFFTLTKLTLLFNSPEGNDARFTDGNSAAVSFLLLCHRIPRIITFIMCF